MEEASNGKVVETSLKEVAETGDERKKGAFEEDGEDNNKVEVQSVRGVSVVDDRKEEKIVPLVEEEESFAQDNAALIEPVVADKAAAEDFDKVDAAAVEQEEEKIIPLVEEEESVAQDNAALIEPVVAEEAAAEDSDKVDAAAVEQEEEAGVEVPSDTTANGVVLTAETEETAPVAVDESDVVPVAEAEERATEESVLPEEEEKEGDTTPAAAEVVPKERGEDFTLAQPPADAPAISKGGITAEHGVDKGETPDSSGSPPIISVSRRIDSPTSWKSCCGLFDVLRRSDR